MRGEATVPGLARSGSRLEARNRRSRETAYAPLSRITKRFDERPQVARAVSWRMPGRTTRTYRTAQHHPVIVAGARRLFKRLIDCADGTWRRPRRFTPGNIPITGRVFDSRSLPT